MAGLVVRFMIPYRTLQYQKSYFEAIRLMEAAKRNHELSDEQLSQFHWMQSRFQLAHLLTLLKLIHFGALWLYPLQSQPILAALNVDIIGMAKMDNNIQLLLLLFFALIQFYFGPKLFITYHPYLPDLFYDLTFGDRLGRVFLPPFRYRGKEIQQRLQQSVLYTLNILQFFTIGIHLGGAFVQYQGLLAIVTNWNNLHTQTRHLFGTHLTRPLALVLILIYFELCFFLLMFIVYVTLLVGTLTMAGIAITLTIGFILFEQITDRCRAMTLSRWVAHRLVAAVRFSRRSIVILLRLVPYYSDQLGVFMLVNVPLNGYFLGILIYGRLEPQWIPIILLFMAQQWIIILVLHLMIIRYNNSFIKPNRALLALAVKRRFPLRPALLLAAYLEAFHSCKRYGFGYSQFGLITMLAFCKSILLYGEFVMYTYKMGTTKL